MKSICLLAAFLLLGTAASCWADDKPLEVGAVVPPFELDAPGATADREYLGLESGKSFTISQVAARLIIVEVLSTYCPVCIKQAPNMNKLYRYIQENSDLSGDVKMFAIAAGNKSPEIGVFRSKLSIPFPILQDPYVRAHTALGKSPIPVVYILDKNGHVLFSHMGLIPDIDDLFLKIRDFHRKISG